MKLPNKIQLKLKKIAKGVVLLALVALGTYFSDGSATELGIGKIEYTQHARCRMDCRKISKSEVLEVLTEGTKNVKKSNKNAQPCPVVAMEKRTSDQQLTRVVVGRCEKATKVITVIDLEKKYKCDCR